MGKALHELQEILSREWLWVLDEIKLLPSDLPIEGSRRLLELYKQIPERKASEPNEPRTPLEQLRLLFVRLSEHWASDRVLD